MSDIIGVTKDIILGLAGCAGLWQYVNGRLAQNGERTKANDARQLLREREERRVMTEAGMHSLHQVSETISTDFTKYGAERVILFSGHNCGGIPSPTKPYYVTAMQWHSSTEEDTFRIEDYRRIRIDPAYIKMLYTICTPDAPEPNEPGWIFERHSACVVLNPVEMQRCQIKTYYEAEGVSESLVIFLAISDFNLYYISVARYEGSFSDAEKAGIILAANKIAQEVVKW